MLPKLVLALCYGHDAWIVGSAADPGVAEPRDWDVLVPFSRWQEAALLVPASAKPNSFGGWKCCEVLEVEPMALVVVDVWPGELGWLMQNALASWAWHPRTGARLRSQKDVAL